MVHPLRFTFAFAFGVASAEPIPVLNLEPEATTVSGLSSGAFMAVQMQVAFSGAISGAGIVAGGPYDCADHSLWRALYVCMDPFFVDADPDSSLESMKALAAENRIDPLQGIAPDRLYLFHGQADDTVARSTLVPREWTILPSSMCQLTARQAKLAACTLRCMVASKVDRSSGRTMHG
jgi:poly(3-hydroxybutyrate) depolymerase